MAEDITPDEELSAPIEAAAEQAPADDFSDAHEAALEEDEARNWARSRGLRLTAGIDPGHIEAYRVESAR